MKNSCLSDCDYIFETAGNSQPAKSMKGSGSVGLDIAQADFASRVGVSQSYLFAVEHGRNEVGAEVLLAVSRDFGKSLE